MGNYWKNTGMVWLGSILGMALVGYAGFQNGPGLTFDSENYLYAAKQLFYFGSLKRPGNVPYVEWAPLFPCIVALFCFFTDDLLSMVFWLHTMLFGVLLFRSGMFLKPFFKSQMIFGCFFISLIFSTPLILDFHFVWSEPIFLVVMLLAIERVIQLQTKNTLQNQWILILLLGVLSLERQASIFILPGIVGSAFLITQKSVHPLGIIRSLAIYIISSLPLVGWWIYNKINYSKSIDGYYDEIHPTFLKHLSFHLDTLSTWFVPDEIPVGFRIFGVLILIWFLAVVFTYYRNKISISKRAVIVVFSVVFVVYFGLTFFVLGLHDHPFFDEERILSVVYFPGMALVFLAIDELQTALPKMLKTLTVLLVVVWLVYPVTRGFKNVLFWKSISASENKKSETDFLNIRKQ